MKQKYRHFGARTLVLTATAAVMVGALGSGAAFAYFSSGGSGTGAATTGSGAEITVANGTTTGLYPGGKGSLTVTINNPYKNTQLTITGITAGPDPITVTGGDGTCTAANSGVSLDTTDASPSQLTVAGGADPTITFSNAVAMDATTNHSGCQGATFSVPLKVNVKVG